MTRAEESALIFKILNGDKDLFRQIVDAHGGMILAVLYRMTGNREDAEDMAQETFVKAYFSLGKYRGESSISTWLYSIAYHLAVSSIRKKMRTVSRDRFTDQELQQSSLWLESGEDVEFKELRERQYGALEKAVTALEPQDRFLITAFYEQGRSLAELTQITGMSLSNVKVRLFRCRNRLARILKDNKDLEK
ncbi:MAG TPA: RNA polymerase sigma factor [Candidatus Coprenecus pullicola]|nr:RNA polymerase sigma factor [Candidatus Coprenecus pullicola]